MNVIPTTNRRRLAERLPSLTVAQAFDDEGLALDELRVTIEGGKRSDVIDASLRVRYLVSSRGGCSVPLHEVSKPGRLPVAKFGSAPADRALGILALGGYLMTWRDAAHPSGKDHRTEQGVPVTSIASRRIPTTIRDRVASGRPPMVVAQVFVDGLAIDALAVTVHGDSRNSVRGTAAALRQLASARGGCELTSEHESPYGSRPTVTLTFTPAPRALGILTLSSGFDVAWDVDQYPPHAGSLVDVGDAQQSAIALELAS